VGEDRSQRYTVTQAADILGISPGAVRNRLSRGTLPRAKEGGVVYVLLPADMSQPTERDTTDIPPDMSPSDGDVLTSELRDRLRYVEEQLEAERQAHAEARRLLMAALERIPPQLEPPETPVSEASPGPTDTPNRTGAEPQEGVQRPWWRRIFGD